MEGVDAVLARRDRLATELSGAGAGRTIDGDVCGRMSEAAMKVLPDGVRYDAVYRSLVGLVGAAPAPDTLRDVAGALAGDVASLRGGRPVWPPSLPNPPADVVVRVAAARRLPPRRGAAGPDKSKFRVRFRGRVLVGPGTPSSVEWAWSSGFVAFLARRPDGLGFGKGHRPYQHYSTLVGMRLVARLAAGPDARPRLDEVRCPESARRFNRALTEMRFRVTFACPFAYTHPCHHCPKGQSSCPVAVRPLDTVESPCPACGEAAAGYDPAWPSPVCQRCAQAGRRPNP